jgi:ABC-type dipeptide/oligopeptide/nickel transport system permease component
MHHGALDLRLESITMLTALHRQSPVSSILRSNSVVLHQIPNHLLCVTQLQYFAVTIILSSHIIPLSHHCHCCTVT